MAPARMRWERRYFDLQAQLRLPERWAPKKTQVSYRSMDRLGAAHTRNSRLDEATKRLPRQIVARKIWGPIQPPVPGGPKIPRWGISHSAAHILPPGIPKRNVLPLRLQFRRFSWTSPQGTPTFNRPSQASYHIKAPHGDPDPAYCSPDSP